MDLGLARDRRFCLMAGVGFDAEVVTRHHLARLGPGGAMRTTNRAAYVDPVLRSSLFYRFPPLTIEILDDGRQETLQGTTAFVFNLPDYALGLPIAPTARGNDGLLDVIVFRNPGTFHALRYLWLVFRGLHLKRPGVEHRRVQAVRIGSTETVPVQLDGDPGGYIGPAPDGEPWTFRILPGAVDVLVPEGYRVASAS
jgi:diacylglycerol kinase family enzyme